MNNFSFPFDTNNENSIEGFFYGLSMETSGFYPFGINEFWHGGIHITPKSKGQIHSAKGIKSIADGHIVAYRLNTDYVATPYNDPEKGCTTTYHSTSFVLVRHILEYPAGTRNRLPIFSFYMHVLPWSGYRKEAPASTAQYETKTINMRKTKDGKIVKGSAGVIKVLPAGCVIELTGAKINKYRKVARIISGLDPIPETLGWVHKNYIKKQPAKIVEGKAPPEFLNRSVYIVTNSCDDVEDFALSADKNTHIKGIRGRLEKSADKTPVTALYARGSQLVLAPHDKKEEWIKVEEVLTDKTYWKDKTKQDFGYVYVNELKKKKIYAPTLDKVIIPPTPIPIKKGELIGYLGQHGSLQKSKEKLQLHWEIFTNNTLKGFIGRARDEAKKQKQSTKTVLHIPKGTPLFSKFNEIADDTLIKETAITVLEDKGTYIKIKTLGLVATKQTSHLGKYHKKSNTFAGNPDKLPDINGIAITQPLTLLKTYSKGKKINDNTLHAVLYPYDVNKTVWIKKTKIDKLPITTMHYLPEAVEYWDEYPIHVTPLQRETQQDNTHTTKDILDKYTDEHGVLWYQLQLIEQQNVILTYIKSQDINHHVPEEFIQFDGVDADAGEDGSLYQDPDSYWKQRFASLADTLPEANELLVSDPRLLLKPFARKVFQYLDTNHDGTISVQEAQYGLKNAYIQKKLASLITQHESEWVSGLHRWRYVEKYLSKVENHNWEHLKSKIESNAWWDQVKGKVTGFPTGDAYYFHPAGFVGNFMSGGCCSDELTVEQLKIIDKHTSEKNRQKHIKGLNETFTSFDINTCLRRVHFLAQVIHESAHLRATREYNGTDAYYAPYFGRGLMQLTLKTNYKSYGSYVGEDFHSSGDNRKKLEKDPHAAKSAGWYWSINAKLNDEADNNDFLAITFRVNGGFNGFKDRYRILNNAIGLFELKDSVSTEYKFEDSWIYNHWKGSLGWGMWHDVGSNKFKAKHCDPSIVEAKKGYKRFLKLIKDQGVTFPQKQANGKNKYHYGHTDPKTYVESRLKLL